MTAVNKNDLCYCGCGEHRGQNAEFLPGHDGKLRHILDGVIRGEMDLTEIKPVTIEHRSEINMIQEHAEYKKIVEKAAHQHQHTHTAKG